MVARSGVDAERVWVVRTVSAAHAALQIIDLRQRGVLAACAQQIAEAVDVHAPGAALVEEGEGFLEVCALRLVRHVVSVAVCSFASNACVMSECRREVESGGEGVCDLCARRCFVDFAIACAS